jgi:hypothetical protein
MGAARHVTHAAGPVSVVAVLAAVGFPAVATAAGVAVLVLAAACWVLSSKDRTDRVSRIILARRGDVQCLYPADSTKQGEASVPARVASRPNSSSRQR